MRAIYPGSFDPPTNGHLDIIARASCFVDFLTVAVVANSAKKPLFSVEERINQLEEITSHLPNVNITTFSGLTVEFAHSIGANVIIRGLRAVSDFEYEFQMALTNRSLVGNIETLFIPTSTNHLFLSSSVVKEVASYGGKIDDMVPPQIRKHILEKYKEKTTD